MWRCGGGHTPIADHLGYRVAVALRAEWITVLRPPRSAGLARWATVSQARPSRRRVLAAGVGTAALVLAGPIALTGCTVSTPAEDGPDPLEFPARRAETDAAQAIAAAQRAAGADSGLAAAVTALAADRTAHATALRAEIRRAGPGPAPGGTSPPVAPRPALPPAPSPAANPDLVSTRSALTQAMHAAQDEAARLVMTLPGYRAALLASVAACCATHAALLS